MIKIFCEWRKEIAPDPNPILQYLIIWYKVLRTSNSWQKLFGV